MRLDEARAIHKKTGQKYKLYDGGWIHERDGSFMLHETSIQLSACEIDDSRWEVEPLPEKAGDKTYSIPDNTLVLNLVIDGQHICDETTVGNLENVVKEAFYNYIYGAERKEGDKSESQKQDEEDLEFLNFLVNREIPTRGGPPFSELARIIKRKCFGVNA